MIKKLKHLSVSSLKLHAYSPRRWVLQYIEGIKEPEGDALRVGKHVHEAIENRYNQMPFEEGQHLKGYLDFWEANNGHWFHHPDWRIEDDFKFWLRPWLPPLKGRIDMWRRTDDNRVLIVDHKTATEGWTLSEEDLKKDWQLSLYAYVVDPSNGTLLFDGEDTYGINDEIVAQVTHNQLIKEPKTTESFLYTGLTSAPLTRRDIYKNISEIQDECEKVLTTIDDYGILGLKGVNMGNAKPKYYGRLDPYWACMNLIESVDSLKEKINGR
jgi:hypothetical protein